MVLPTQTFLIRIVRNESILFRFQAGKNWNNTDESKTLPKYRIGVSLKMSASPFSMSFSILSCLPEDRVDLNRMFTIY